jgi:hypothetical protein
MRELVQAWHGWPPPQRILRILHPSQARLVTFDREAGMVMDSQGIMSIDRCTCSGDEQLRPLSTTFWENVDCGVILNLDGSPDE